MILNFIYLAIMHLVQMQLVCALHVQAAIRELADPFTLMEHVPATMDLREYGLVTTPIDLTFTACGTGAAAVASLAESNMLRAWPYWKNHRLLQGKRTSELQVSVYFLLNATHFYKYSKGYYCTGASEYIISDVATFDTIQLNSSLYLNFQESDRHFNPEFNEIQNITIDGTDMILEQYDYIYPFFTDENYNSLVILFHTPYFSLSGDESASDETIDLMKQYLARGITLISQIHLGSDKQFYYFYYFTGSDIFQGECIRIVSKFYEPAYEEQKKRIIKNGYDEMQERIFYVNIVGYGKRKGTDVWIVKTPFGASFGNLGYLYFSIGNNTLCLEEYVVTALPNHVDFEKLNGVFTVREADELGLEKFYDIYNLVAQEFGGPRLEYYSTADRYSTLDAFALNAKVNGTFALDTTITGLQAGEIVCRCTRDSDGNVEDKYDIYSQNCSTEIIVSSSTTTDQQRFYAACFPVNTDVSSPEQYTIAGILRIPDSGYTQNTFFYCYPLRLSEINGAIAYTLYRICVRVYTTFVFHDVAGNVFAHFPVRKAYLAFENRVENAKYQQPQRFKYFHASSELVPEEIGHLNLIPGFILCKVSLFGQTTCKRRVFDYLYDVEELWDCTYTYTDGDHIMTCYAPEQGDPDIGLRKKMRYFGEIRQNVTPCMLYPRTSHTAPDFRVCPPTYNMNFTSARVRLNESVSDDYTVHPLTGSISPLRYVVYSNDSVSGAYVARLRFHGPEVFARMPVDVAYSNGKIVNVILDCAGRIAPSAYQEQYFEIYCRNWAQQAVGDKIYVCDNLLWYCNAPLSGWSSKTSIYYSLVGNSRFPLIFKQSAMLPDSQELPTLEFAYEKIKLDSLSVKSAMFDPENFAFNPCQENAEINVSACKNVLISDVYMQCASTECSGISTTGEDFISFTFEYEFVHALRPNSDAVLSSSQSTFFCEFYDYYCTINRRALDGFGFVCDRGLISCKGTSKTIQNYFADDRTVVDTRSGTSIFTFNATDFECDAQRVKSLHEVVNIMDANGNQSQQVCIWVDLVCRITTGSAAFSSVSSSPKYLTRDGNSVDDVLGNIELTKTDTMLYKVFAVGLILGVSLVICISAALSVWPGSIKHCTTLLWNALCCERMRVYNTNFDKHGVSLLKTETNTAASTFSAYMLGKSANATLGRGFYGLTIASLMKALEKQENKISIMRSYSLQRFSTLSSGILKSDLSYGNQPAEDDALFAIEAEDIQTLFKRKRQNTLTYLQWLNDVGS